VGSAFGRVARKEGIMSILATRFSTPRLLRSATLALVLAAIAAGVAPRPALADDGWHRGHERHEWREHAWRGHAWREHEWRLHHAYPYGPYAYGPPAYVYAPAPAYGYAPPPVVYAPPVASLNFVFPLGHR
jgi:hypothetical protein